MNRRGFLGSILAARAAPYVVTSGVLMPVRALWVPPAWDDWFAFEYTPLGADPSDPLGQYMSLCVAGLCDGVRRELSVLLSGSASFEARAAMHEQLVAELKARFPV